MIGMQAIFRFQNVDQTKEDKAALSNKETNKSQVAMVYGMSFTLVKSHILLRPIYMEMIESFN
jgi:hypothetical protein